MVAALSPQLALAYLRELSTDIRAAAVLDQAGTCVAGDASLAKEAGELLGSGEQLVEASTPRGRLFVARGRTHSVVVLTGRFAVAALVRHDLRKVLEDLAPTTA